MAGRILRAPDHDTSTDNTTILGTAADEDGNGDEGGDEGGDDDGADGDADADSGNSDDDASGKEGGGKDGEGDGEPNPLHGAPEGDYDVKLEGTEIDTELVAAIAPVAKELNLSNDGMTKLAGIYAEKVLPRVTEQVTQMVNTQAADQAKAWDLETRAAIEGGVDDKGNKIEPIKNDAGSLIYDGKSFKEVQKVAARALDRLGTPELREFLETSGLGNNEALVRFAYRAGKAIKEDTFERGNSTKRKPTDEELFYGSKS